MAGKYQNLHQNTTIIAPFYRPASTIGGNRSSKQENPNNNRYLEINSVNYKYPKTRQDPVIIMSVDGTTLSQSQNVQTPTQINRRELNSHSLQFQSNRKQLIVNEVIQKIYNSLIHKDSRINSQFLMKVTQNETQKAFQSQKLINSQDIEKLERHILGIVTNEINIIKKQSIEITQPNHYLQNSTNFNRNSMTSHHPKRTQSQRLSQNKSNMLKSDNFFKTSYQSGFSGLNQNPSQSSQVLLNYQEATPQTTSLPFKDFQYDNTLKSALKDQHQHELNNLLKYQMHQSSQKLQNEQERDQIYAKMKQQEAKIMSREEKISGLNKRRWMVQSSQGLKKQHSSFMKRMQQERNQDLNEDYKFINQNLNGIFQEKMNKIQQRNGLKQNEQFIKSQMLYSQQKLLHDKQSDLSNDKEFISSIGFAKGQSDKSGKKVKAPMKSQGTIFDQFYNRQPHKAFDLAKRQEQNTKHIIKALDSQQQEKLQKEQNRIEFHEQDLKVKDIMRDYQQRELRENLQKQVQNQQKQQMKEQIEKLRIEKQEKSEIQRKQESQAREYENELWRKEEEKRMKLRQNKEEQVILAEKQNQVRFLESLQ
eukprot:403350849